MHMNVLFKNKVILLRQVQLTRNFKELNILGTNLDICRKTWYIIKEVSPTNGKELNYAVNEFENNLLEK